MKRLKAISILAFCVLLFSECKNTAISTGNPACIQSKIDQFKKENVKNPPLSVWQYDYKGITVYYVPPYCCDIPDQLFDANCNLICNVSGGFRGKGDSTCADFYSKRTNEKLLWRDDRK